MGNKTELTPWPDIDENILHIYSQIEWHGDAFILGTAAAITALRDACDKALRDGHASTDDSPAAQKAGDGCMYVNDGEGYQVCIAVIKDKEVLQNIATPYTDEIAKDKGELEDRFNHYTIYYNMAKAHEKAS